MKNDPLPAFPLPAGLPRSIELPVAALALLVLGPFLLALGLLVRLSSPGPAFFRQQRVGRHGRPFTLIKLRSMVTPPARPADPGEEGARSITAGGDPRITSLGRFLRSSKLDELPELWNIVRGELSFVGPRPEVPAMVDLGDPRWRRVLEARPGLTDAVTLRLRNEEALLERVPAEDRERFYRHLLQPWKLAGYVDYLERRSPWRDLGLIWDTVTAIVLPRRAPPPSIEEIAAGYRPRERT